MRASIDKDRDMARSILPSKNRREARAGKRQIVRSARRASKMTLGRFEGTAHRDVDDWDARDDLRAWPDGEISHEVSWRRQGDKIHHLERWAVARTRHLPVDDRLPAMRAVLPRGLIGDHAMTHLARVRDLRPPAEHDPWWWWDRPSGKGRRAVQTEAYRSRLAAALRIAVNEGHHRDINQATKAATADLTGRPRLLGGLHDIDDFAAHLAHSLHAHLRPREHRAIEALLDQVVPTWRTPR